MSEHTEISQTEAEKTQLTPTEIIQAMGEKLKNKLTDAADQEALDALIALAVEAEQAKNIAPVEKMELNVQFDTEATARKIEEIVDTDFFRDLQAKKKAMKDRTAKSQPIEAQAA